MGNSPCVQLLQQPGGAGAHNYLENAEIPVLQPVTAVTVYNQFTRRQPSFFTPTPGGILPQAVSSAKQPRNEYDGLVRVDYNLTSHHTIDARTYITNADDYTSNSASSGMGVSNYEIDNNSAGIYSGNVGDTRWWWPSLNVSALRLQTLVTTTSYFQPTPRPACSWAPELRATWLPALPRIEAAHPTAFMLWQRQQPMAFFKASTRIMTPTGVSVGRFAKLPTAVWRSF